MKKLLSTIVFTLLTSIVFAQVSKTINVTTAGTLSSLLTSTEKTTITNLTVSGNIDVRDIKCMRDEMTNLSVLNLSTANIKSYYGEGTLNGATINYPENEMPQYSFLNIYTFATKLTSIVFPTSLTSIGNDAFRSCSTLQGKLIIPSSVVSIGASAFEGCAKITGDLTFSNSLKTIGNGAFAGLGITGLTLGSGVTKIEYAAFWACTELKKIISLNPTPPTLDNIIEFAKSTSAIVYVPIGSLNIYQSTPGWSMLNLQEYKLKISTAPITSVTLNSALFNGSIDLITTSPVTSHGFCWNTSGNPTILNNIKDNGAISTEGIFNNSITGLSANTTYYVKAYATDGIGTFYGDEVSFKTASLPSDAGLISGLQTVCQGQNSVTYSVPTIECTTSYIWSLPDGVTGASTTNTITVSYSRTFTSGSISVKGHNEWGDGIASTLAINANLLPVNAGIIIGSTSVCQGENYVIYTVPTIDNATSYIWTLPTGATGSSQTNSITVDFSKTALSGNITVKGHNDCGDGIVYSLPITVNKLPIITTSNKAIVCGGSVSLNPTINYTGNGTLKYSWTPTTGLNDSTVVNPTSTVTSDIVYSVTVTTPNGCTATDNISVKIIPMDKPQLGIVSVNSSNKNIIVWNKPVTTGIESYLIYRETNVSDIYEKIGNVPYSELSVYTDTLSLPDVKSNKYKISILDKSGLETLLSDPHKTMHLSINKGQNNTWNLIWEPYTGFTPLTYNIYRGNTSSNIGFLDAVSGSSTQYSDISAPSGDIYYQVEVISPTLVSPSKVSSYIYKINESENATTMSYNSSRSNLASNILNGVNDLGDNSKINVYPNPVKNELKVDFEGSSTYEILNLMGQVVLNGEINNNSVIKTSTLTSGIYLIRFNVGKAFVSKKIIKE